MKETQFSLDDIERQIADLEVSFELLREFDPSTHETSNNSCCHIGSCYTF
ncbi:MAG TPA: hypothetical protein VN767_21845 [Streptosporangiaceae bacterium]|jgi:hypothetical protein|nr:hypothetical protein [Streptosporangiaceae bacterium]